MLRSDGELKAFCRWRGSVQEIHVVRHFLGVVELIRSGEAVGVGVRAWIERVGGVNGCEGTGERC